MQQNTYHGYPHEANLIWQVLPALTGFRCEFEFSSISIYGYGTGNGDIGTHQNSYPNPPKCRKSIYYPFYINRYQNPTSFHSCSDTHLTYFSLFSFHISHLDLAILCHHSHRSPSSLCWIMHYNIVFGVKTYFYFYLKKNYPLRG